MWSIPRIAWMSGLAALVMLLTACDRAGTDAMGSGMGMDPGMMERHMAPIPPEYAGRTNPIPAEAESLLRGEALYQANCAVCHGELGWGDGPAAAGLNPPPAPLAHTATMMPDAYLFYRISEGGGLPPFNSAMPAWKDALSEDERWDVINYARSLGTDTMMGDGGTMMDGMRGWVWLAPLLGGALLIGLVVAVALVAISIARRQGQAPSSEAPIDILKRRLARGEITSEQYEAIRQQLGEE